MDYIILTGTIVSIGGSVTYTRNKVEFLENHGWRVRVHSFNEGEIIVKDLEKFISSIIKELRYPPYMYTEKKFYNIIKDLISGIDSEGAIIESHTLTLSLWGEILADKVKGKHIVYSLHESYNNLSDPMITFLDFKHRRRELAGITKDSLQVLFKGYKYLKENEKYYLKATCTNVVEDIDNDIIDNIRRSDINIGSITRLEKKFVQGLVDEVLVFANKHKDKNVQLIFYGGSDDKDIEKNIHKKVKDVSNLNLIITGFLFPIPRKIFRLSDVFVSVAGSAGISAREMVPTITVDVIDGKPIGVLGYDTNNSLYRDTKSCRSISQLLEDVLTNKDLYLQKIGLKNFKTTDFMSEFMNHLKFIEESEDIQQYYDFSDYRLNFKEQIKRIIFRVLGIKGYKRIRQTSLKIRKNLCQ